MQSLFTFDNKQKQFSRRALADDYERDLENLRSVAGKTVSELQKENPAFLVYPPRAAFDTDNTEDKIGDSVIFNLTQSEDSFTLKTANLMGFIGIGGTELNILSRFAHGACKNEGGENAPPDEDYFLHYMLQKVFTPNITSLESSRTRQNIFDFLPFLFPKFLCAALKQGLYKEYQWHEYNDSNVRGPVDVNRHIRFNIPPNGKIAYRTREYSFDNPVTQLVRHTIEYIRTNPMFRHVLNCNEETKDAVSKIDGATPSYKRAGRAKILSKTLRAIKSPYYSRYRDLQKLCRMILLREKIKYDYSKNKIYGILFDGAWLWEEYIWTLLKEKGFEHPRNKTGSGVVHPFSNPKGMGNFYPDFYLPKSADGEQKASFVIDTKYKGFDTKNPGAEDLHQMISYIHVLDAECGKFLYPSGYPSADEKLKDGGFQKTEWTLKKFGGKEATLGTIPFFIPQNVADYNEFTSGMEKSEEKTLEQITSST